MGATSKLAARFSEGHSLKYGAYTEWKAEILQPFTSQVLRRDKKDPETGKVYPGLGFFTSSCVQLKPYHDVFYAEGKRVFPPNLHEMMTPFVLAVWFMDDGSIGSKFHPRIAFGLDELSRKRAFRALRTLGLKPVLHDHATADSIEFPGQSDLFFEKVEPHLVECMRYKLPQKSERREKDKNAKLLTSEKAKELFDGGMSITDLAKTFGLGRSTAHRRVHAEGPPKRMGRPKKSWTLAAATEYLRNLDPKEWGNISEDDKEMQVQEVLSVLRKTPFPAPKPWSVEDVQKDLAKLVSLEISLADGVIQNQSWRGTTCCGSFFEHRYSSSYRGKPTAFERWHEDDQLLKAIRYQFRMGHPVIPKRVLRAVSMQNRTPGVFRPVVAKFLYQNFCNPGELTWDPCAGWGGRLMGATAAGVRYLATEVEPKTAEGNRRLAQALGVEAEVVLCPAENFDPPTVDFVFTSPPYFDVEHYGDSDDQSFRVNQTFEGWVEGFLRPVIRNAYKALKEGGVLALNVAMIRKGKNEVLDLPAEVVRVAVETGFRQEETLYMPLAKLNRSKEAAQEPILVFRK